MNLELHLLGAFLKDRSMFEKVYSHLNLKRYSKEFQHLLQLVRDYYHRDNTATAVNTEVFREQTKLSLKNPKHAALFDELIQRSAATDAPVGNVEALILDAKRIEVGNELMLAIANRKEREKVNELVEVYRTVAGAESVSGLASLGTEVTRHIKVADLLGSVYDPTKRIRIFPKGLNNRLKGGLRPGHHVIVVARPEAGKTALVLTMACGLAHDGRKGIYFGNEDPREDIESRILSCLIGWTDDQIRENPEKAQQIADESGVSNILVVGCAPGSLAEIEEFVKAEKPEWIIVDQMRNLATGEDNRVISLEKVATGLRNIAKRYGVVVISVTQAGDSGSNKAELDMGDVDFSNTGIPAQADVMVMLGVTPELEAMGERCINLPKNKVGGRHEHFIVRINTALSRISSPGG